MFQFDESIVSKYVNKKLYIEQFSFPANMPNFLPPKAVSQPPITVKMTSFQLDAPDSESTEELFDNVEVHIQNNETSLNFTPEPPGAEIPRSVSQLKFQRTVEVKPESPGKIIPKNEMASEATTEPAETPSGDVKMLFLDAVN